MYDPIKAKAFEEVRESDPEYIKELSEYKRLSDDEYSWFHETGKHLDYYHDERRSRMKAVMDQARKVDDVQVRIALDLGYDVSEIGIVGLRNAGKRRAENDI